MQLGEGERLKFRLFPYQASRLSGLPRIRVLVCELWSSGKPRAESSQRSSHSSSPRLWMLGRALVGPASFLLTHRAGARGNPAWPLLLLLLCTCGCPPWAPVREIGGFSLWPSRGGTCTFIVFHWNFLFGNYFVWSVLRHIRLWERGKVAFSSLTWWRCFGENNEMAWNSSRWPIIALALECLSMVINFDGLGVLSFALSALKLVIPAPKG